MTLKFGWMLTNKNIEKNFSRKQPKNVFPLACSLKYSTSQFVNVDHILFFFSFYQNFFFVECVGEGIGMDEE